MWTQAASFDDLTQAYPASAGGAEGYVLFVAVCAATAAWRAAR